MPNINPIVVSSGGGEGWNPPSDWGWDTASALITDSDDGFVALVAVYPNKPNYVSFMMQYTGGGGMIDWGDTTTSALAGSGVANEKTLNYANVPSAVTSRGYKVATVKILISGTATGFQYARSHSSIGSVYCYSTQYIAIKQRTQNATVTYNHCNPYVPNMLELLDLGTDSTLTASYPFIGHSNLKKVTLKAPTTTWSASRWWGALYNTYSSVSAFDLDAFDWTVCNNMIQTFENTTGGYGLFEKSIPNVTSLNRSWNTTKAHSSVILTNTGNVTDLYRALYQSSVTYFSMDDASSITTTTQFVRNVTVYGQLTSLILTGLTIGINLSYQKMSATAIDNFFTSLGTANGTQTITVTGNIGASTCDTSIATAKGYTVIT